MDELNVQHLLLVVFTTIYLISFRESVKRTALWGSFEFGKTGFFHRKILCSAIVLILIPLSGYFFFSRIVFSLPQSNLTGFSTPIVQIPIMTTIILLLGLFPRATKHFWSYVAKRKTEQGTNKGEPGYGWLNDAIVLNAPYDQNDPNTLPHKWYSIQTIIILGVFPLSVLLIMAIAREISMNVDLVEFILKLYLALYISQIYVLYQISKKRGYYDHKPEWLLSKRMLLTYPTTIIIPMAFGIAISPLLLRFTSKQHWLPAFCFVIYLLAALPFPFCCHQSWLIRARKKKWKPIKECPEYYESKGPGFWYLCLSVAFMVLLIYAILYRFAGIGYALMWDKVQSFKF